MRASVAIALFAISTAASAAEMGTLFHTAKERDQLERLRKGETPEVQAVIRADPVITGYVKRSDGKSTVFIDKQPVPVRNPRLERRLQPKAVERYEPWPVPEVPEEEAKPAEQSSAVTGKSGDSKTATSSAAGKTPAPRKRGEKDN